MPSFLEKEQLLPVQPVIAPADQILGAFNTRQSLFGIGAAQVKNAASSYNQMQLSNPQNQQQLDGLLQQSNQDLKSASLRDLSVADNQTQALSVFDPIMKDQNIMGDHALTQAWGQGRSQAESARVSNGGKNFNAASLDAINYQQALFAKSDKSTWKQFYSNKETYSPYYNTQDESQKIAKGFKTDVIEKDQQNGAYITTSKDSSWYKDKWQQYFEANASPQLKAQIATQARAEYYRDMLTMPKEAIVQKYTNMRNGLINKQMSVDAQNMMNVGASLAMKHDSKDNSTLRSHLIAQANYLSDRYSQLKAQKDSPLEQGESLGDVNSLSIGSRIAENLGQYQYYDKTGDAFAHQEVKTSIKPDFAYLGLAKIREQSREFGIRQNEEGRHNRATEGIQTYSAQSGRITAEAAMLRASKAKNADGSDATDDNNPTDESHTGTGGGLESSNKVGSQSDPVVAQDQGKKILDHLSGVETKYNNLYDSMTTQVFYQNFSGALGDALKDPTKQNMTLADIPDPTRNTDGSGGNANRVARFLAAAGALTQETQGATMVLTNPGAAYSLTVSQVQEKLRRIWSDPAMLKAGLEAIKGNGATSDAYAIASTLEVNKQRIDGEHADIVNQALPILKSNLDSVALGLLSPDYLNKGRIPTYDEVLAKVKEIPLDRLKDIVRSTDISMKDKASHMFGGTSQEELFQQTYAKKITKDILGTLGNNRTAYNSQFQDYFPNKGNAQSDNNYKKNVEILISGAEQATKGTGGSEVDRVLKYAQAYPELVDHIRMNSVDEAHDLPYFQVYFKKPSSAAAKADPPPPSGMEIQTTRASQKFKQAPLDDRTTLLNNRALKFGTEYNDGSKSNLSIYNSTGDKSNPQFDINPDFSYKAPDIDVRTGDIKGIVTIHKSDEVNNLTGNRPDLLSDAINRDPTQVYNTLANKIIKNRDAVNFILQNKITNIKDLPQYLKDVLPKQQ